MFAKISQIDFADKEVKYEWCRAKYQAEAVSIFQSETPNDASSSETYYE